MYALSRRNLERRFKKATCNTVTRIHTKSEDRSGEEELSKPAAKISMKSCMMWDTMDHKAFRTTFKKDHGLIADREYAEKIQSGASGSLTEVTNGFKHVQLSTVYFNFPLDGSVCPFAFWQAKLLFENFSCFLTVYVCI
jgi:hypothetical protein